MDRKIKFRGKRVDNGLWLQGSLFVNDYGHKKVTMIHDIDGWRAVDPDTVGQFIELQDKNKIDVCENDIVKVEYYDNGELCTETVTVTNTNGKGYSPFNWEQSCDGCDYSLEIKSIEVIGNIHGM